MEDYVTDMNVSNTSTTPVSQVPILFGEHVFVATMQFIICFLGSVGNLYVILAVLFSKKLQTTTNVFVFSLSCADLLYSAHLFWLAGSRLSPSGWPWPNAYWLCKTAAYLVFTCFGVSVYNLTAISVNRLILIKYPNDYRKIYTPCSVAVMVATCWVIPLAVGAIFPLVGIGGFGYDSQDHTCSDLDDLPTAKTFSLIHTLVGLPIPLIILTYSYARIYFHVRRHFGRQRRHQKDIIMSQDECGMAVCKSSFQKCQMELNRQQWEITKNLFTVFIIFVIIIMPFFLFNLFPQEGPITYRINLYLSVLFLMNSAINPFLYAAKHPHFKIVLRLMLKCRCSQIPEPTDFLKTFIGTNKASHLNSTSCKSSSRKQNSRSDQNSTLEKECGIQNSALDKECGV